MKFTRSLAIFCVNGKLSPSMFVHAIYHKILHENISIGSSSQFYLFFQVFHAPSIQQEIPFEFRIRYKFLSHSEAIVRYGSSSELYDLGSVTPGTYCTRQFEECSRNKCRLQSPNYPGMYPRNVSCYWTIRQKTVPTCKHAMIAVSQENSHKSLVKRSIASLNKTTRTVRAWSGEKDFFFYFLTSSISYWISNVLCGWFWQRMCMNKLINKSSPLFIHLGIRRWN